MYDWNDLRFFLGIHRARTLAGASRALSVEHTTVGRRLTALETALGATLFVRTPDGFSLTAAGASVLPLAEQAEVALLAIERAVLADDDRPEGVVRITTSETFAGFIGRRLADLRGRHPGITVEVHAGNQALDLTRREADIAIRMVNTTQPDLLCRRVGSLSWGLYAAQSYLDRRGPVVAATDLRGHDVIGFDDSLSKTNGATWLAKHGTGAHVVLRSGSIPAAYNAALGGLGIVSVPCFLAAEGPLVRVTPERIGTREVFVVVHPDLARVARVRVVLEFLVEFLTAEADVLAGTAARGALRAAAQVPKRKGREAEKTTSRRPSR